MNKGIVIAGNLIVDHVKICDNYPKAGMLTNIREVSQSIGGCAGNTAADIAIIDPDINVSVLGKVGNDADGVYIKGLLSKLGVGIGGVLTSASAPTSFTDVMSSLENNERTFFHARGANAEFSYEDIDFSKLNCDIFHMGYALLLDRFDAFHEQYGTAMAMTLAKVSSLGIKTSIDVVSEEGDRFVQVVTPCLKHCDYLIINEVEASRITGHSVRDSHQVISQSAVKSAVNALFEKGVREVVCLHSPEGGWYSDKGGGIVFLPSLNLPDSMIKGKVGAGDAFCAGMLYSLYRGFDPEYSLRVAGAAAGCNLTEKNSIDGLRPFEKMMEFESEIGYIDV